MSIWIARRITVPLRSCAYAARNLGTNIKY